MIRSPHDSLFNDRNLKLPKKNILTFSFLVTMRFGYSNCHSLLYGCKIMLVSHKDSCFSNVFPMRFDYMDYMAGLLFKVYCTKSEPIQQLSFYSVYINNLFITCF